MKTNIVSGTTPIVASESDIISRGNTNIVFNLIDLFTRRYKIDTSVDEPPFKINNNNLMKLYYLWYGEKTNQEMYSYTGNKKINCSIKEYFKDRLSYKLNLYYEDLEEETLPEKKYFNGTTTTGVLAINRVMDSKNTKVFSNKDKIFDIETKIDDSNPETFKYLLVNKSRVYFKPIKYNQINFTVGKILSDLIQQGRIRKTSDGEYRVNESLTPQKLVYENMFGDSIKNKITSMCTNDTSRISDLYKYRKMLVDAINKKYTKQGNYRVEDVPVEIFEGENQQNTA